MATKPLHVEEPEPISPVLAYEAGLRDAAQETGDDPLGRQQCRNGCGRHIYSMENDGWCDRCAGLGPSDEEIERRCRTAWRQGFLLTAKMLRNMASQRGIDQKLAAYLLGEADWNEARARR